MVRVSQTIPDLRGYFVLEGTDHFHAWTARPIDERTFRYYVHLSGGHPPDTRVRIYFFRGGG